MWTERVWISVSSNSSQSCWWGLGQDSEQEGQLIPHQPGKRISCGFASGDLVMLKIRKGQTQTADTKSEAHATF